MARLQTYHIGTPVKNSEVSDRGVPVTEVFPHIVTSAEAASAHAAAGLPFVVMGTKSEAAHAQPSATIEIESAGPVALYAIRAAPQPAGGRARQ